MKLQVDRPRPVRFLMRNLRDPITHSSGLFKMLPFWLKGFGSEYVALFELDRNDPDGYLPDFFQYRITHATNRNVWPILHDKLLFHAFMRDQVPITPLLAVISEGRFMDVGGHGGVDTCLDELMHGTPMVVKPLRGGGGGGLTFLRKGDGDRVSTGSSELGRGALRDWLRSLDYHGVYRHETQHPVLERLYPDTTNTLRVHVFRGTEGPSTILGAVVRVGVEASRPVDNFNQGALSIFVDTATGSTGRGVSRGRNGRPVRHDVHPETGVPLTGIQLPHWQHVREALLSFHDAFPAFDLVGWDIVITPTDFRIIEGNHNPNLRTTFVHHGLHACPAFLRFCEHRGLTRRRGPAPHERSPAR